MKGQFILLGLAVLAYGCNGGGGGGGQKPSNDKTTENLNSPEEVVEERDFKISSERAVVLEKDFSNLNQFKSNLNSHIIRVSKISGNFQNHKVSCRSSEEEAKTLESSFNSDGSSAEVRILLDDTNLDAVQVKCKVSKDDFDLTKTIKLKKSVAITFDRKIETLKSEDNNIDLDTLLIDERGVLYSDENDITLKAKTLVSNKGTISNFLNGNLAEKNMPGLSGGNINLHTLNAYGILKVELRGQNGGVQFERPDPKTIRPPTPDYLNGTCGDHGGNTNAKCAGKKGLPGIEGDVGFAGLSGGDTGSLDLKVKNLNHLKISVKYFPGQGGRGGEGGDGGPGGLGGKGSVVRHERQVGGGADGGGHGGTHGLLSNAQYASADPRVTIFPDGPVGDHGKPGAQGPQGIPGTEKKSYILKIDDGETIEFDTDWAN